MASEILSINVGRERSFAAARASVTGIDKQPVSGWVEVRAPGPEGSGVAGDSVCDLRDHGGDDQAVYAYASEDLRHWATELDRPLGPGVFGENLTTAGLDLTGALIGQRWRIGELLLEVSAPRIPCRTFAAWLGEQGWVKNFTEGGMPGAYLRVLEPGRVRAGQQVRLVHQPEHEVTIGLAFRALTTQRELLPMLLAAPALPDKERQKAAQHAAR